MLHYGVTVSDILSALRTNRKARAFWNGKGEGFAGMVQTHTENIRDLQIMLLDARFPNNTFPVPFKYGTDFTPYVMVDASPDDMPETVTDSDVNAFADSIIAHVESVTGEKVSA